MWVTVIKSYLPEDRASSIISGVMALPHSTSYRSAGILLLTAISNHLLPKAPTENTAALLAVQDLMAPSINPLPELVDNRISC